MTRKAEITKIESEPFEMFIGHNPVTVTFTGDEMQAMVHAIVLFLRCCEENGPPEKDSRMLQWGKHAGRTLIDSILAYFHSIAPFDETNEITLPFNVFSTFGFMIEIVGTAPGFGDFGKVLVLASQRINKTITNHNGVNGSIAGTC